jgi:putative transposase
MCDVLGYSRQAYYKQLRQQSEWMLKTKIIIESVKQIRTDLPKTGTVKIHKKYQNEWAEKGVKVGRDKTFDILRENGLLQRKRRQSKPRTTMSNHWYKKYPDLIKGQTFMYANQLWVSDITYVMVDTKWVYLFLITDAVSHKIVGYHLSRRLDATSAVNAMKLALKNEKPGPNLVHHSDRGIQYCSNTYTNLLLKNKVQISMTQSGSPYDNAIAERINGILKNELIYPFGELKSIEHAHLRVNKAVKDYNNLRLHMSIEYKTPDIEHQNCKPIKELI